MPDAHVVKPEVPDRLRARTDFVRIQKSGRRFRGQFLVLMLAPGAGTRTRVGFTVSRRVGNAVVRNRVRRLLRELVRAAASEMAPRYDYVLIAEPACKSAAFDQLREEVQWLLDKSNRWVSPRGS